MVDALKMSDLLIDFARTLTTDFAIQNILDHLVESIVEVLPVDSAGVTLIDPGATPRYVAASSPTAQLFVSLQSEFGQGPCVTAYDSNQAVAVPDLVADDRFPVFGRRAREAGLAAVFTFPLRHEDLRLGALDLYCNAAGVLSAPDMEAAQTLADVASAYLLNAQACDDARSRADELRYIATHDSLTGLSNRFLFEERLKQATQHARYTQTGTAVLFADIDRFKQVNDEFGHRAGDELLLAVARRMSEIVRSHDTLARVSGDEFIVLCEGLRDVSDVSALVLRIQDAFRDPFTIAGVSIRVSVSIGMAYAEPGQDIIDQLVDRADHAMYQVKRLGGSGNRAIVVRAIPPISPDPLELDLRGALADDEIDVAYQPFSNFDDDSIAGFEALLRWNHPVRGAIAAPIMIQIAEQTDLIADVGEWVLRRACQDHARWPMSEHGDALDLAVNVSARQLAGSGFVETVKGVLAETNMAATSLVLEMTENIIIEDSDRVLGVLHELGAMGIRLALDDFGTGYSSMSYLARLPIHIVKIDRSFVAGVDLDQGNGRAIVRAITRLAHELGFVVIAEGVETIGERNIVEGIGCDYWQGYLRSRPIPAAMVLSLLETEGRVQRAAARQIRATGRRA